MCNIGICVWDIFELYTCTALSNRIRSSTTFIKSYRYNIHSSHITYIYLFFLIRGLFRFCFISYFRFPISMHWMLYVPFEILISLSSDVLKLKTCPTLLILHLLTAWVQTLRGALVSMYWHIYILSDPANVVLPFIIFLLYIL
jgi:hypothetical protein